MNNDSIVDINKIREFRELETALRNEIQTAKGEILCDLQKKEEYLTHLIRVLIAKVDALEQEQKTAVVIEEKPKTASRRIFRLL